VVHIPHLRISEDLVLSCAPSNYDMIFKFYLEFKNDKIIQGVPKMRVLILTRSRAC
jgi:hypothetical protein